MFHSRSPDLVIQIGRKRQDNQVFLPGTCPSSHPFRHHIFLSTPHSTGLPQNESTVPQNSNFDSIPGVLCYDTQQPLNFKPDIFGVSNLSLEYSDTPTNRTYPVVFYPISPQNSGKTDGPHFPKISQAHFVQTLHTQDQHDDVVHLKLIKGKILAELSPERADLERRLLMERDSMAKRLAYLTDCRAAAEKEKNFAQSLLSASIAKLDAAEKENLATSKERIIALEELKHAVCRREPARTREVIPVRKCPLQTNIQSSAFSPPFGISELAWPPLQTPSFRRINSPVPYRSVSAPSSVRPDLSAVSPRTATSAIRPYSVVSRPQSRAFSTNTVTESECDYHEDNSQAFGIRSEDNTAETYVANPIGPYIRPPMPVEDMQKCIRCLLGKDKSLKTGNRARAFLGLSWSQIVALDPDTLLQRGVSGIKAGSTGMASRLRMMTIIESALANQGNNVGVIFFRILIYKLLTAVEFLQEITEEIWERPTFFCERCQERYPITVSSNQAVPSYKEYEAQQRALSDITSQNLSHSQQPESHAVDIPRTRSRRNRKRARAVRQGSLSPYHPATSKVFNG
ncbi:hypothetical protein BU17DRAFT_86996 [Hysterangium stoloniferum]|nr:hypothetical protein BU17DRAFT_86996 [Hysterangium stoloniferum]